MCCKLFHSFVYFISFFCFLINSFAKFEKKKKNEEVCKERDNLSVLVT